MRQKTREKIVQDYLYGIYEHCDYRIEKLGDLDFDDWLYKTRDATRHLIKLGGFEIHRK